VDKGHGWLCPRTAKLRGLARWRDSLGSIRARGRPIPWRLRFPDRTRPTG
jgi:hypothetical protein